MIKLAFYVKNVSPCPCCPVLSRPSASSRHALSYPAPPAPLVLACRSRSPSAVCPVPSRPALPADCPALSRPVHPTSSRHALSRPVQPSTVPVWRLPVPPCPAPLRLAFVPFCPVLCPPIVSSAQPCDDIVRDDVRYNNTRQDNVCRNLTHPDQAMFADQTRSARSGTTNGVTMRCKTDAVAVHRHDSRHPVGSRRGRRGATRPALNRNDICHLVSPGSRPDGI